MKNDKHLINETEYASLKGSIMHGNEGTSTQMVNCLEIVEGIIDRFTELADENPEDDIYTLIYRNWNDVTLGLDYQNLDADKLFIVNFLLVKFWYFGDVFSNMHRINEMRMNGTSIGHSIDGGDAW